MSHRCLVSLDAKAKELFHAWLSSIGFVEVGKQLGKLPLQADVLVTIKDKTKLESALSSGTLPSWMSFLVTYNLIEFKSEKDKLVKQDLAKIVAYAGHLMASLDSQATLRTGELSVSLIVSSLPKWASFLREDKHCDGVFRTTLPLGLPCMLVVIDELGAESSGIPLLFFGSTEQRRQVLREMLSSPASEKHEFFYKFSAVYYTQDVICMAETGTLSLENKKALWKIMRDQGIKEFFDEDDLRTLVSEVGLKAVISEVGLDELADLLDPSEVETLVELQKNRKWEQFE